jgi:hypothetical protein
LEVKHYGGLCRLRRKFSISSKMKREIKKERKYEQCSANFATFASI